jgi:hypothetical protein
MDERAEFSPNKKNEMWSMAEKRVDGNETV